MTEELRAPPALHDLTARAESDPNVVGLVLTGSHARAGMATEHSDIDVYVVVARPDESWQTTRSKEIDIPVCTLDQLRHVPGPDEPDGWWDRYSFTHSRILLDRSDGEVTRLVEAWGSLSGTESKAVLESHLDGYINWAYRSGRERRPRRRAGWNRRRLGRRARPLQSMSVPARAGHLM